eukprot:4838966-Heterocapsa_arctica.AAC.4
MPFVREGLVVIHRPRGLRLALASSILPALPLVMSIGRPWRWCCRADSLPPGAPASRSPDILAVVVRIMPSSAWAWRSRPCGPTWGLFVALPRLLRRLAALLRRGTRGVGVGFLVLRTASFRLDPSRCLLPGLLLGLRFGRLPARQGTAKVLGVELRLPDFLTEVFRAEGSTDFGHPRLGRTLPCCTTCRLGRGFC